MRPISKSDSTPKTGRMAVSPAIAQAQAFFSKGLLAHQQGRAVEASLSYNKALELHPRHVDSLHLLGVLALQEGRSGDAVEWITKALAIEPGHAAAHNNLGNALDNLNQPRLAIDSFNKAIALQKDFADAYNNRGAAFRRLGQFQDALDSYDQAIKFQPDYAQAHYNRGNTLRLLKQSDAALESYRAALRFKPDYAEAWNNAGNILKDMAQFQLALEYFDKAIALKPAYADAHNNRGNVLRALKNVPAAIESFRTAITLKPTYAEAFNNLGNALAEQSGFQDAIDSYDQAIALKPDYAEPYSNRGNALRDLGRLPEAMKSYEQAIALKPDYADAQWNHSLCLLLAGDFAEGFRKYEWRWQNAVLKKAVRDFSQPLWLGGQSLAGKTLLLHAEQGLGDTLHFCRYVPMLRDRGARVVLEVQAPLQGLLAGLEGVAAVVARGQALPAFDIHCPLLSLPLALGTSADTVPADVPYLAAPAGKKEQWAGRLGPAPGLRAGLVWSGSPGHTNDRNRSIALADMLKHLPAGVELISLQKEIRAEDSQTLAAHPKIRRFDNEITDFTDTAALCELVDVVISVDTSVAHLAGALGRPVWMALPFNPDWRWMLERKDSPWYPSATLYRQSASGDWAGVLRRMAADLERLMGAVPGRH